MGGGGLSRAAEEFVVDREQILNNLAEFNAWVSVDLRSLRDREQLFGLVSAEALATSYLSTRKLKREITTSLGNARAEYGEMITVAASETKVVANKVETLKAQVDNNIALAINSMQTSINTVDRKTASNATAITGLQTQVDNVSSSVTMKAQASISPGDNWARWGVQVKTGSGNQWSTGALYIDVKNNQSRVVVQANDFVVTNGSLHVAPLTFANGVLRRHAADIGTVTAGNINIQNRFKVSSTGEVEIKTANTLQRLVITNRKIEVFDNNNQLRVRLGIW